jgi:uncharacterized protein YdeI (YjbR/CyaY-like superfamily)
LPARPRAFREPEEFRDWLRRHHASESELVVRCRKAEHARSGLTYRQALDEALCFGWIDGVRHGLDETSFTVRFTPRKAKSAWSRMNLARAAELQAEGRMRPAGLAALQRRTTPAYSYETVPRVLTAAFLKRLRADREAWHFFQGQPPGYQRTSVFWILSAKRPGTREARFAVLLQSSKVGTRIPLLRREARPTSKQDPVSRPRGGGT